jgi:hypothetical protein
VTATVVRQPLTASNCASSRMRTLRLCAAANWMLPLQEYTANPRTDSSLGKVGR